MSEELNENAATPSEQATQEPQAAPAAVEQPVAAAAVETGGNALANFLALKESNPKVFYGAVGGVALLLLIFVFSGGSEHKLPVHQNKAMVAGQSYILKSANAADGSSTVRLVSVPGSMAAYDDTEENDREGACKHMPQGTPVKLIQTQDAFNRKEVYGEVEMLEGECQGKRGWALTIDLQ
jgi:hypothetical protein